MSEIKISKISDWIYDKDFMGTDVDAWFYNASCIECIYSDESHLLKCTLNIKSCGGDEIYVNEEK